MACVSSCTSYIAILESEIDVLTAWLDAADHEPLPVRRAVLSEIGRQRQILADARVLQQAIEFRS